MLRLDLQLLARHHSHLAQDRLGTRLRFTDGTSARVYRETRLGSGARAFGVLLARGTGCRTRP
ncbi:hypothetical protein ACIRVK_04725 [Streptomyces sp. NPDC101152]|uniref:hypothetical protein n=1 Tax=Streptomyces sp. NPDC101152 TaxID=3366116 RepID=UPI003802E60C